jgi:SAM-dependent methyltransferase
MPYLSIDKEFRGTLLDFGCGMGDAMPIYNEHFPNAKLIGMDISPSAVNQGRERYGAIATFINGTHLDVPEVDVIIASNVIEHLDDDRGIVAHLASRCRKLFVIVPYKESPLHPEHVNYYDEQHFLGIGTYEYKTFLAPGWSYLGFRDLFYHVYFKNLFRWILGRPLVKQREQILFSFSLAVDVSPCANRPQASEKDEPLVPAP